MSWGAVGAVAELTGAVADLILVRAVTRSYADQILDDERRAQFRMLYYAAMINFEQVYIEYKPLGVETEPFEVQRMRSAGGVAPDLVQAVWNRLRIDFPAHFKMMCANTARTSSHSVGKLYVMALCRARIIRGNAALSPLTWCSGVIQ
jgi:hypothetical protein